MSAFMVGEPHINAMIGLAQRHFRDLSLRFSGVEADEIGRRLVAENRRSINYRYPDTVGKPEREPGPNVGLPIDVYTYQEPRKTPTAVEGLSLISCYRYQACEHPEWRESWAYDFCEQLQAALIRSLPGYKDAPWEWTAK